MTKFILYYSWGNEGESGICVYPFEYSSKDDFCLLVLDMIEKHKQECIKAYGKKNGELWYKNGYITVLGQDISVEYVEDIERCVYTLDEWFEANKLNK